MGAVESIHDASLDQRVVLLALVEATGGRETPVNPAELRSVCTDRLATPDSPVVGGLSEADVTRALYTLESEDLVENVARDDTSPTGKGRPAYELVVDAADARGALADHDDIAPLLDDFED